MAQTFTDLTLPAHDPDFPKPRGLIAVPSEVAEQVADEEVRLIQKFGGPFPEELRRRLLDQWTLTYYYDEEFIAYRRTPQGVEVLAVGRDEVYKYVAGHPLETRRDVRIGVV
jgi:hypothetical protein